MRSTITSLQSWLVSLFLFILPLFIFPLLPDPIISAKWYLLALFFVANMMLFAVKLLLSKKITIRWTASESILVAFGLVTLCGLFFTTPNKTQGFLSPIYGFATIGMGIVLYFTVREHASKAIQYLFYGTFLSAVLFIAVAIINPFAHVSLPPIFTFLSTRGLSTAGTIVDTIILFGFFALTTAGSVVSMYRKDNNIRDIIVPLIMTTVIGLAAVLAMVMLLQNKIYLSPFFVSWLTALETLKNPLSLLFGFGFDNFISVFTKVKPISYNANPYWTENFRYGMNMILHVWTESGLVAVLFLLLFPVLKLFDTVRYVVHQRKGNHTALSANNLEDDFPTLLIGLGSVIVLGLIFPPTFTWWILLLVCVAQFPLLPSQKGSVFDLTAVPLLRVVGFAVVVVVTVTSVFYIGKGALSDFYFKQGILHVQSAKTVYSNTRNAIQINPYNETYRMQFAQINISLANELAKKGKVTDQDRQTILEAIKAAISEAKALVTLNPKKASYWMTLASVYRNIISLSKGSDVWATTSYQRAIVLDPYNPSYRFALGTLYYSLKNYPLAVETLQQAVQLKGDQPNYFYNLAWSYHQNNQDDKAIQALNSVLALLSKDSPDYKKAQADKDSFSKALKAKKTKKTAETTQEATPSAQLQLQKPQPTLSPQIALPSDLGVASESGR